MSRISVIGGGLTGLAVAHVLAKKRHDVVVLEADGRFGGQLHTQIEDGYVVEHGAEGFVARSTIVPELARELGIENELMGQSVTRTLGYRAGELRELAAGEAATYLGFQVPREDFGGGVRTFQRGMGSLSDALVMHVAAQVELERNATVTGIERRSHGYRITRSEGRPVDSHRVVLATSSKNVVKLLGPIVGPAALQLSASATTSSVTVSLAYERSAIAHALDATGIVVASEDQLHGIRAVTFTSAKLAHRAPSDKALLRVFFRPTDHDLKLESDATFAQRAADFIENVLQPSAPPAKTWTSRWPHTLPVFDAAHHDKVRELCDALAGSGIALAGSAFFGAGIDAALRSALSIDERL